VPGLIVVSVERGDIDDGKRVHVYSV
jgi:hypothetical protein